MSDRKFEVLVVGFVTLVIVTLLIGVGYTEFDRLRLNGERRQQELDVLHDRVELWEQVLGPDC